MRVRVKVCCMASTDEAATAISAGADALGLVGEMPSGPGPIPDDLARKIASVTPPAVTSVLLTSRTRAGDIAAHVELVRPAAVQIVNHIDESESARLRHLLPGVKILQVVHVEGEAALNFVDTYAPHADAFLLDSGQLGGAVLELGGTGRVHDWTVSARFVEQSPLPVFLAGGLKPENIGEAIRTVRPYGVDLCTGVRTEGALDETKLRAFMAAVREAA